MSHKKVMRFTETQMMKILENRPDLALLAVKMALYYRARYSSVGEKKKIYHRKLTKEMNAIFEKAGVKNNESGERVVIE